MSEPGHLGPYRLLHVLGRGGMGEVWEVSHRDDPGLHRALKTLGAGRHEASVLRALIGEAKLGALLQHPNIVQTLDVGVAEGRCYFVMELLDGRVLHQLRFQGQRLPLGAVATIAFEVLDALEYAHELGVVHRDLKPSNIFITTAGEVKVIDFGVARAALLDKTLTRTGAFKGTPAYASPEQIRGAEQDGRSDLYALGLILRELLSGEREVAKNLFAPRALKPLGGLNPEVSEGLEDVLLSACAWAPEARPPSAAELARRLRAAIPEAVPWTRAQLAQWVRETPLGEPGKAVPNETTSIELPALVAAKSGPSEVRPPPRRRRGPILGIAGLLLATVVSSALFLRPAPIPTPVPVTAPVRASAEPLAPVVEVVERPPSPPAKVADETPPVRRVRSPKRTRVGKMPVALGPEEGAFLTVDARPVWAQVFVDGRALGPTPLVRVPLRPGRRHLRAVNAEGVVSEREVTLGAGREERLLLTW